MTAESRLRWCRINSLVRIISARTEALASGYHDTHGAALGREEMAEESLRKQIRELATACGISMNEKAS
jgi:hypothetical protein